MKDYWPIPVACTTILTPKVSSNYNKYNISRYSYVFSTYIFASSLLSGFDENGERKLKVVNPNGNHFEPIDPDLVKYLTIRNNAK